MSSDFGINSIIFYFAEVFEKIFSNLDCKNLESNPDLILVCEHTDNKDNKTIMELR
jgi:hypothetical protein